jgi:hypothetical protein
LYISTRQRDASANSHSYTTKPYHKHGRTCSHRPRTQLGRHALLLDSACSLCVIHEYVRSPHTMQQHPHKETLSSIISILQTRTTAGLTTHLSKIEAHNKSKGNEIIDQLANIVANGQPHDAIHLCGVHTYLGQWTCPYTTQSDEPNPPKTLIYTNLKKD